MNEMWKKAAGSLACAGFLLCGSAIGQTAPQSQNPPSQQAPAEQKPNAPTPATENTLKLDNAAPPVNAEEDAAYKALYDPAEKDPNKKIQAAQDFLAKYPQTRYKQGVLSLLTHEYLMTNQSEKALQTGEQELQVNPNDVQTLAGMAQVLTRAFDPSAPDAAQRLDKAEQYSKRAIQVTPTLPKPDTMSEQLFEELKNAALASAHGSLGLVQIRRAKYEEAIPELQEAVRIDPNQDPVNYYLLGKANEATSHFDDAVAAYTKCAALNGQLQAACKAGADESKKKSNTQLSAPN